MRPHVDIEELHNRVERFNSGENDELIVIQRTLDILTKNIFESHWGIFNINGRDLLIEEAVGRLLIRLLKRRKENRPYNKDNWLPVVYLNLKHLIYSPMQKQWDREYQYEDKEM